MSGYLIPEFITGLEQAFIRATLSNDAARIADLVSDDWIFITPGAGPIARSSVLEAVTAGFVRHDAMVKETICARVIGDVAWATGHVRKTRTLDGRPLAEQEYVTNVYCRDGGEWRCMLTHSSPIDGVPRERRCPEG